MFSSDSVVRVKEATIFQDNTSVLDNLTFEIEKGEFVFLIGRTGSGKSSLLKTLYGDLPLRLGDIQVATLIFSAPGLALLGSCFVLIVEPTFWTAGCFITSHSLFCRVHHFKHFHAAGSEETNNK